MSYKVYEPISDVRQYDAFDVVTMDITADVTRGALAPIRAGNYLLTIDQSRSLRLTLERAERDVRRGPGIEVEVQDG